MRHTPFILLAFAALAFSASANAQIVQPDGSVQIAGRSMRCGGTPTTLDSSLPMEGAYIPGQGMYLNPSMMQRHPGGVRAFVFRHECAHKSVGGNELAADCAAVRSGVREGWFTASTVREVCASLAGSPRTATHPSGATRCAAIKRCFAGAGPRVAKKKPSGGAPLASGKLKPTRKTNQRS